jgi:hypothetical protein
LAVTDSSQALGRRQPGIDGVFLVLGTSAGVLFIVPTS